MTNTEFSVVINNIVKRNNKEITAVDFKNWTNNNIEVRKYIPITEKAVIYTQSNSQISKYKFY